MTTIQMNAELFRRLSIIAEQDPTLMTKEEFFANVDEALEQVKQGRVHRMLPDESLDDFLKRVG